MRYLMANGRIPRKTLQKRSTISQEPVSQTIVSQKSASPNIINQKSANQKSTNQKSANQKSANPKPINQEPLTPQRARERIAAHRGWPGMRVSGHLNLHGLSTLYYLPDNLTCRSLDISDCPNLTTLPPGLHVTQWIEVAGSGLNHLPVNHGFILHWRGVPVSDRIIMTADSMTGQEILNTKNVELRRVLIERMGYETFLQQVGGLIRDHDRDVGGDRQLICIPFDDDEPLMMLKVMCPSTGHLHLLRVPPHMRTCHQSAAWVAGFDNPDDYHPIVEA